MTTGFSIGGIASGLDTASMIQQLMQIERQPIFRLQQRQADLKKVDAAWGEVTTKVQAFRAALDKVRDASDWSSFVSPTSSNEEAVTVTTTGAATPSTLDFTVTSLASRHKVAMSGVFTAPTDTVGTGNVTIDGTTITTDASTTLAGLATMIDESAAGVDAQVLKVSDAEYQLVLTAKQAGQASQFTATTDLVALDTAVQLNAGSDAALDFDGLIVKRSSNTITDLVDGVTIDLKATTASKVTVEVGQDTTKAADAVEAMVKAANDVLATLKKHTAYSAESDTAGVLQGDASARSLQMQVRSILSSTAGAGAVTHGSQVGISLTRGGAVEVDRSKLDDALGDDHDAVATFMVDGLGAALDSFLDTVEGSGGSIKRAREAIDGRIRSYDDQIEAFEVRLALRETTIRRQFTGLETALAQLQSQGNWLAGQLGSMTGA